MFLCFSSVRIFSFLFVCSLECLFDRLVHSILSFFNKFVFLWLSLLTSRFFSLFLLFYFCCFFYLFVFLFACSLFCLFIRLACCDLFICSFAYSFLKGSVLSLLEWSAALSRKLSCQLSWNSERMVLGL